MAGFESGTKGQRRHPFHHRRAQLLHPWRRYQADGRLHPHLVGFPPGASRVWRRSIRRSHRARAINVLDLEQAKNMKVKALIVAVGALALLPQLGRGEAKTVIRLGHFPNITHAQGVIAHALTRQHKGWFEERLRGGVEIQWYTYNT